MVFHISDTKLIFLIVFIRLFTSHLFLLAKLIMMKYFAKWLTNKKRQALFPAGTIVEGFYHPKPLEVCTITNIAEKPEAGFETM